jgi:hypothetical protein
MFWNKIVSQKIFNKIRNEILEENLINTYQSEEVTEQQEELLEEQQESEVIEERPSLDEILDKDASKKKKKMIERIVYEALVYRKE